LLDACAQLTERLLKACPNLQILTTSRDLLRLEGEAAYYVPSLSSPQGQDTLLLDDLVRYEAVQLFADRAALAASGFKLTERNMGTVVRICNRLDGIPLAIELAAARVDIFSPDEILKQLERSFDLLASQARTALPRHQTMRTSIDWGWNLLTDPERLFVRQLSVFTGGWTLHAAQALSKGDVVELTSTLLKKSFIVVQQQSDLETRYGFHEVVRAYAQEKLLEAGEEQTIRDRHLGYVVELLRQLEPALQGVEQDLWVERLFFERDNIRAALGWAAKTDVRAGLYLSDRLRTLWESYDLREEARWLLMI
jgi:predicted ATPase